MNQADQLLDNFCHSGRPFASLKVDTSEQNANSTLPPDILNLPKPKYPKATEKQKDEKIYKEEVHNSWLNLKLRLLFGFGAGLVSVFYAAGLF